MYALILAGCTAPLVDEVVLGADVAVETWEGAEGDELGGMVAVGDGVLALARGAEAFWVDGTAVPRAAEAVGFWEGEAVFAHDGKVRNLNGMVRGEAPDAKHWAFGAAGAAWATSTQVGWLGGASFPAKGVETLAVGVETLYALRCDPDCVVEAWDAEGALGEVMAGQVGGALMEWEGELWAGMPDNAVDDGAGRVCAESGVCVEGEVGDHLGQHLGGGYAVGDFNKWIVPARARLVPVGGGTTFAMERGAETQPITLAGDGERLVVGAPYVAVGGAPAGIVQIVSLP